MKLTGTLGLEADSWKTDLPIGRFSSIVVVNTFLENVGRATLSMLMMSSLMPDF